MRQKATFEGLKEECAEVQENSGMGPFVQNVIHAALRQATFRSIDCVAQSIDKSVRILRKRVANKVEI